LGLATTADVQVLAIVNQAGDSLALNLKAPLVVHVAKRIGRQIVAKDGHSVQHLLDGTRRLLRTA
jgi:flagellar assembly factor FliW